MNDIETLWNEYRWEIASYIGKRMLRQWGQDTVNDLVSTVFLKAIVAISHGNGSNINERAWLYSIARSCMADFYKSLQYKTFVEWDSLYDEPGDGEPVEELAAQAIIAECVRAGVHHLEGKQQQVMALRLEGYPASDMAEIVGSTDQGVRAITQRAFRNLRLWLEAV